MYELDKLSRDENRWRKRAFECELKNIHDMKSLDIINRIHYNKVYNIYQCTLLNYILKTSKSTKRNYSLILLGYINSRRSKVKFKNCHILLDCGFISTTKMRSLMIKLNHKKTMWCNIICKWVILLPIWNLKLNLPNLNL